MPLSTTVRGNPQRILAGVIANARFRRFLGAVALVALLYSVAVMGAAVGRWRTLRDLGLVQQIKQDTPNSSWFTTGLWRV